MSHAPQYGCGCRACRTHDSGLHSLEREVLADLFGPPPVRGGWEDAAEAGLADGDDETITPYRFTWSQHIHVSTGPGTVSAVKAELGRRMNDVADRKNGIYQIWFGNNLAYVGMTGGKLRDRVLAHFDKAAKVTAGDFALSRDDITESQSFEMMLFLVCTRKLWPEITVRITDESRIRLSGRLIKDMDQKGLHALELLAQVRYRTRLDATRDAFLARAATALGSAVKQKLVLYDPSQYRFEDA